MPLRHPSSWVEAGDLDGWLDDEGNVHRQHKLPQSPSVLPNGTSSRYIAIFELMRGSNDFSDRAVNAILGIEADNLANPDNTYWRMGYTFPVQLTNWA